MRNLDKGFKFDSKLAYIGNIQVSKGTLLTQIKKFQEDAQNKKLMIKNFNKKEPNLNEENKKKTQLFTSHFTAISMNAPLIFTFKENQPDLLESCDPENPVQSKLMAQSKKISKSDHKPLPLQIRRQTNESNNELVNKLLSLKVQKENINHKEKLKRSTSKTISTDIDTPKDSRVGDQEELLFDNGLSPVFSNPSLEYEMLHYESFDKSKQHQFRCFKDSDLKIKKSFSRMIIHHEMDDDCDTDDEQISSSIKTLHFSLRFAVEDEL